MRASEELMRKLTFLAFESESSGGTSQVLINELHDIPLRDTEYVLLQVVHTALTHRHDANQRQLRKLLLFLASRSFIVGIRINWVVDSVMDVFAQAGLSARVNDLTDVIENATVNRMSSRQRPMKSPSAEELVQDAERKQLRCAIFNNQRLFVAALTTISQNLRSVPDKSRRKGELHRQLADLEAKMPMWRAVFPMGSSDDPAKWIVGIVVEECLVFSSRERAPYLVWLETITDPTATLDDPANTTIALTNEQLLGSGAQYPYPADSTASHQRMFSSNFTVEGGGEGYSEEEPVGMLTRVFGETSDEKKRRIRETRPNGSHPGWGLEMVIVKAGDDLRQEELALQLIAVVNRIWEEARLTVCVRPYGAMATYSDGGIIQCVADAVSIDSIKKSAQAQSLHEFFVRAYGGEDTRAYCTAQRNFIESMAGYSVVSYLLQIKDRHNGNLLLTRAGHLVHIDFGFLFTTSPGGIKFESAPFKLSQELMDVMGGANSATFGYFKVLVYQAFQAVRERATEIIALIELLTPNNTLPCFGADAAAVLEQIKSRFRFDLSSDLEFALYVKELVATSVDNWRTRKYDQFQTLQNGII